MMPACRQTGNPNDSRLFKNVFVHQIHVGLIVSRFCFKDNNLVWERELATIPKAGGSGRPQNTGSITGVCIPEAAS